jgi:hypothetical protein
MNPRPIIFLSAVSRELKSVRQLLADVFESLGVGVEVQDIFNVPTGDLRQALREKIDHCCGVVHLIGQHYGFEPPVHETPFDPCSYTQLEARYGLDRKIKVWFLLLDKAFPPDNASSDSEDGAVLQQAWRVRIRKLGHVYENLSNRADIEIRALRIAHEVNKIFGVAPKPDDLDALIQAKIAQAFIQFSQTKTEAAQAAPKDDPAAIERRAYETLEKKLGLKLGILATEVPQLAARLLKAPDTGRIERARALYAEKKYDEAEREALEAKADALTGPGFSARDAREALELAADCARAGFHYPRATEHLRAALALADENREPAEWAGIAHRLALVLHDDGKYGEGVAILQRVVTIRERVLGAEHRDTLASRNNLASELRAQGKYAGAEAEHRAVLAIMQRVLGAEHPDTLTSRMNIASALYLQAKYPEAEKEYRETVEIKTRVLGAEHPDTLASRMGVAIALDDQGRHAEAEAEHRAVLAIRERVLGAEHPDTLASRSNLAAALDAQGKHAEAEAENRARIPIEERVLGADHPDTLTSRNNLANGLQAQGKNAEAETEHRAVLAIQERVLGEEHPDIAQSCYNLAICLKAQAQGADANAKKAEALVFAWRALAVRKKTLGDGHPETQRAQAEVAALEKP